ncbi:MAG: glycoside hydrolase family 9 protein [Armatimonadota bacterium]
MYKYFWNQRCGVAVPGWHGVCHADDGLRKDNLTHIDAVGWWHDAGDYNKFPHGFAGDALFALLWLYENNRAYYDAIDEDSNGIPDIVDEALHQARWLVKMVEPSGHVMKETQKRRVGPSWVRPEQDTDNVVGNWDDGWINPGDENTPQEITCCAALVKMHRILASLGKPTENFCQKALAIWDHRMALAQSEGGHNNLGNAAMQVWAGLDLYSVTGREDCRTRAVQRVAEIASSTISNPGLYDSIRLAESLGYELGVLAWFARNYPDVPEANLARTAVVKLMEGYKYLADNPVGLIRRVDDEYGGGSLQFFPTNPDWNGFYLGINRLYLLLTWAGIEAYRLIYDPSYLCFAIDQYNWVTGANHNRVCMMEQAGDFNLPRYHTRYDTIPGHSDGKQPGVAFKCVGV